MNTSFYRTLTRGRTATEFLQEHDGDVDAMRDAVTDEANIATIATVETYNDMLREHFGFECRVEALRHLRALMNDASLTAIQRYHVCRLVMQFSFDEPRPHPARRGPRTGGDGPRQVATARRNVRKDEPSSRDVDCANDDQSDVDQSGEHANASPVPANPGAGAGIQSRSAEVQAEELDARLHGNDEVDVAYSKHTPRTTKRRRGRFRSRRVHSRNPQHNHPP